MRKTDAEAAQTREAIVSAAADYVRRTGIAETSLIEVMAAAGLTHGGFYRHFRNKEHLVAEAIAAAGSNTIAKIEGNLRKGKISAAIDGYLSTSHRDAPIPLCPFAALGSEMARASQESKDAATAVLEKLIHLLEEGTSGSQARGQAVVTLATMVGAMTLARIASGTPLSNEIINSAKQHLRHLRGGST